MHRDDKHHPCLKSNIAHFPAEFEAVRNLARPGYKLEHQRLKSMIELILDKPNVYTGFSCRATSDEYYACLKKVLRALKEAAL